jgi:hypothetical protein
MDTDPRTNPRVMMGLETSADQRVALPVRHWHAMQLALWRSKVAWDAVVPQVKLILDKCDHAPGCPGALVETESCLPSCPDREQRLSALVILAAARQFAPIDARKLADAPYFAPTRERFSEVIAALVAAQAELDALRARGHVETPAPNTELPPQLRGSPRAVEVRRDDEEDDVEDIGENENENGSEEEEP